MSAIHLLKLVEDDTRPDITVSCSASRSCATVRMMPANTPEEKRTFTCAACAGNAWFRALLPTNSNWITTAEGGSTGGRIAPHISGPKG